MLNTRFAVSVVVVFTLLAASSLVAFSQGKGLYPRKYLSLDLAMEIAQAALDIGHAQGHALTAVVVIDRWGLVKVMLRGDDGGPQTADVTRKKAYTALAFSIERGKVMTSTEQAAAWAEQKNPSIGDDRVALGGGVAIMAGDEFVGAIGVSGGGGGDKEDAISKAAIAKLADKLK